MVMQIKESKLLVMHVLGEFLQDIPCEWNGRGSLLLPVERIVADSRTVEPGDLFVAIAGPATDGHRFIPQAVERGAIAVVSQSDHPSGRSDKGLPHFKVANTQIAFGSLLSKYHQFPANRIKLIGITGTNGKTTTAYLMHHLLNHLSRSGMIGTVQYVWGNQVREAGNTTPGSAVLMPLLNEMARDGCAYCVMEVSSQGLDQHRTAGLAFEAAIFTNLSGEHLDYHVTMENYYAAKRKLFLDEQTPEHAIINIDDRYGKRLFEETGRRAVSFGFDPEARYRIANPQFSFNGAAFDLCHGNVRYSLNTTLPLGHNIYNVTAAITALSELGFRIEDVISHLEGFPGVPGRMQRVDEGQAFHVFVDYAHTPDAVRHVLDSARRLRHGNLISVIGCGGDRDKTKRPVMGQIASELSDAVVVTSDNPRSEDPEQIMQDVMAGIPPSRRAFTKTVLDRREAIGCAMEMAKPGDLVLILGKGHEKVQIIGKNTIPFDDCLVAREWIHRKTGAQLKSAGSRG